MPAETTPETMSLREFISLPTTVDFHVVYSARVQEYLEGNPKVRLGTLLAGGYAVLYTSQDNLQQAAADLRQDYISMLPQIYTVQGREDLQQAGISQISQLSALDLRGRGVVIGFVDTGIDYTNRTFQYEDGTSKIISIWDQTLEGDPPEASPFGAVFTNEEINAALSGTEPFALVPHRDMIGHGTFLASVACGREPGEYTGAAPDAEIIAVKLRKAHPFFLETAQIPPEQQAAFASTDILLGIKYILDELGKRRDVAAVVICLGVGSNFGGHDGSSILEKYMTHLSHRPGIVFCTAAGDESTARHHAYGILRQTGDVQAVDVRCDERVRAFRVLIVSSIRDRISVSARSPTGELVERIPAGNNIIYRRKLLLETSLLSVFYSQTNVNAAFLQVEAPAPGIWRIYVRGNTVLDGTFHAWLPVTGLVDPGVEFVTPAPTYTIVLPSTSTGAIVCGAHNGRDNSPYVASSWGPSRDARVLPDLSAPGVGVSGVFPNNRHGTLTGTSAAAAITAGACAILMQWGAVEKHFASMTNNIVKSILIMGCDRDPFRSYPNVQWGYGRLNLTQSFFRMRER